MTGMAGSGLFPICLVSCLIASWSYKYFLFSRILKLRFFEVQAEVIIYELPNNCVKALNLIVFSGAVAFCFV